MATTTRMRTTTALTAGRPGLVGIDTLAREAGMRTELAHTLIGFGLLTPSGGTRAAPLYRRVDAATLARAARLRRDLGVNYAGAVLACELLARIDELEAGLRRAGAGGRSQTYTSHEVITWTPTG
jgi:hypothetical protein